MPGNTLGRRARQADRNAVKHVRDQGRCRRGLWNLFSRIGWGDIWLMPQRDIYFCDGGTRSIQRQRVQCWAAATISRLGLLANVGAGLFEIDDRYGPLSTLGSRRP
jgi:hypothetical protein